MLMDERLITIGIVMTILGIMLTMIGAVLTAFRAKGVKTEWAFGGFIGPIPFGFATKSWLLQLVILISFILLLVIFILNWKVF